MKIKKWLFTSVSIIITALMINTLFLYYFDMYGVSSPNRQKHHSGFQQRFRVTEHMLKNHNKYNSLLFGSSRVQFINPTHINEKTYNMTIAEGIPHEYLLILKLLLKNDAKFTDILIGLDDFSYQVPFSKHQNIPESKSHYLATGISKFDFYKLYYLRKPNKSDFIHIKNILNDKRPYIQHHEIIYNQKERFSKEKYEQPKPTDPAYDIATLYHGDEITDTINDIKKIYDLCRKNDINIVFFINPIHITTYKKSDSDKLEKFKKELSYVTSFYDFTKQNKISKNNKYWIEPSHYTLEVGDMILSRIYDNNTSIKDFGIYVPKK